ncbi:hypothetical protein [Stenotrophomonas sp. NPDC078853]|uniref:hypothetical protein n=1 Tax=Stenotrophomonas sp. NPDC078853 TaxID=3364534 RepID=UPI00384F9AEE
MKINRDVQRRILEHLAQVYPNQVNADFLYEHVENPHHLTPNIAYLEQHGLIEAIYHGPKEVGNAALGAAITAKGVDFLADDGGLGAILGVVTIKVHEDQLKQLIAAKIETADLDPSVKETFLEQLRELPGEATKSLALKLVDAGLANWQKALPVLQGLLG